MKKAFIYIFVIMVSALVFYGGAGINIISYCCNDCRSAGIEAVADHQCCEIHEHQHDHEAVVHMDCKSCINHSHADCCGIERLIYDWSYANESEIDLEPVTIDLLFAELSNISIISLPLYEEISFVMPTGPPIQAPRVYLSLLSTLLI